METSPRAIPRHTGTVAGYQRRRNISQYRLTGPLVRLILGAMWVYVAVWEVQTGEVEQLAVGDVINGLGVRASFWTLEQTEDEEGVAELPGPDPSGDASPHYRVTGTVVWTRDAHSLVLRVGSFTLLAEPLAVWAADAYGANGPPDVGHRVAVVATLSSMLDYEPDAFGYPDVSTHWSLRGLRVEHRELVPSPAYASGDVPGRILRVMEIPRMLRWADAPRDCHGSYLLDLVPPT